MDWGSLRHHAASLLLTQALWETPAGRAFIELLTALSQPDCEAHILLRAYGTWFRAMAETGLDWPAWVVDQVLYQDNALARSAGRNPTALPVPLMTAARHDLGRLQQLCQWQPAALSALVEQRTTSPVPIPPWLPPPHALPIELGADWAAAVPALVDHYRTHGTGDLARYAMLRWTAGRLEGVPDPDPVTLADLAAYGEQQRLLLQNTQILLDGRPALNVLLYGARGTGKSSLVKALVNTYSAQGLRLVEVAKAELRDLPRISAHLAHQPLKVILFVDDLSFEEDDEAFKALKVALEGSASGRPANLVVYATSNRRHLVREFFGDRPNPSQGEIHAWDTLQEKLSFSDRFGLTLTFEPPDQDTYLTIVEHLAQAAGLGMDRPTLYAQALQWATRRNGRSGRTARQFIDFLLGTRRADSQATDAAPLPDGGGRPSGASQTPLP
ncbi:MAG: ATP-binding protein [Gloeomargaritaceae cyanobacterium C42_A2020_066]|nr:ATP-binding protein [Gloeomargaritaceae cyanobacterium C42_A2020_066]